MPLLKKISLICDYPALVALLTGKLRFNRAIVNRVLSFRDETDQAATLSGRQMENSSILACFLKMNVCFENGTHLRLG